MWNFLLDLIFPRKCISCGKWGKFICSSCQTKIEFFDNQVCPYCEIQSPYGLTHPRCQKRLGLDGMFVLAHYRGPIRETLRAAKYQGVFGLFGELGKLVADKYHNNFDFEYFVPVPLHPNREKQRGFNQAELLARRVNEQLAINNVQWRGKVLKILVRSRETKPQFGLKGKERLDNIKGAFSLNCHPSLVIGHSFCLVDDVATTGATIFECAEVLKRAGAKKVWAICAARGG